MLACSLALSVLMTMILLDYRLYQGFPLRFTKHSNIPVEGLGVGTTLEHSDRPFTITGIFTGSKVLMYDFVRGVSIKGVIINKDLKGSKNKVGGPVGLRRPVERSEKVYLHNIPAI